MSVKKSAEVVLVDQVEARILLLRGERVMLDADLAELYGTSTKAFNQAVKRNQGRFPNDFMFQLTAEEAESMRSQFVTASKRNVRFLPHAFTEHGAIMAASALNTPRAMEVSVYVVRAFVRQAQTAVGSQGNCSASRRVGGKNLFPRLGNPNHCGCDPTIDGNATCPKATQDRLPRHLRRGIISPV